MIVSISKLHFEMAHQIQLITVKMKEQIQNKTKQNKTKQNKTKQNKTKQNKTKQNKTKQNKTKTKHTNKKKQGASLTTEMVTYFE